MTKNTVSLQSIVSRPKDWIRTNWVFLVFVAAFIAANAICTLGSAAFAMDRP